MVLRPEKRRGARFDQSIHSFSSCDQWFGCHADSIKSLNLSTGTTKLSSVQFYWFFYGLQKTMVKIVFNIWRKKIGCDSTFSSSNGERQLRGRAHEGSKYTTRDPSTKFPKLVYLVTLCVRSMWEPLSWLFKWGSPCFRRHTAYFCLTI